jgi:hypothetical protein
LLHSPAVADFDTTRLLAAWGILDRQGGRMLPPVQIKTANYTVKDPTLADQSTPGDPSGTIFTNRGAAGAVTFTLFAPTRAANGVYYEFQGVAGQNISVNGGAGNVVTFNNAAATSATSSTAGGLIGSSFRAVCDGTSWLVQQVQNGVTNTVA